MRSIPATLITLLSLALAASAPAQESPSIAPPEVAGPEIPAAGEALPPEVPGGNGRPLTRADLAAWLDGFLPYAMARGDVAGAVVVVVEDGEVLLQEGYGYADVAAKRPVDPERTLFRPGSVSKLFTWTAVMQLVERGELDLDADVSLYLDFPIPPHDGPPITLRNLMTHTPGFDEVVRALIVDDPEDLATLEESLKRWVPPRVTAAGSTTAYSNYGAALAGYIVQRVSGQSFDDYVDSRILDPLGMEHSTFRQPLPESFRPSMSEGYELGSGEPRPFELIGLAPAGSLSASGADMARFMIAHLQNGAYRGNRILEEATAVEMHSTASKPIPPLNGMLLGFYEADVNGHRVIAHGGDTQWFHSDLNLFVDDGVGVFLSVNSAGKGGAAHAIRTALLEEFGDRYFPAPPDDAATEGDVAAEEAREHAALLAGSYRFSRRSHTTFTASLGLISQVKVGVNEDGEIVVPALTDLSGQPVRWREVAPFVWEDLTRGDRLAAEVEDGRVVRFGYDRYPFMLFEPVPWWASSGWLLPLAAVSLVALLLTTLAWPVSALVRRRYGVAYGLGGLDARAHRLVRIASLLVVLTMIAVGTTLGLMFSDFSWMAPGIERWIGLLRVVTLVVLVAGAATASWNAGVVIRSRRRWPAKVWSVVLAVSCLTLLWVGVVFKLIGFSGEF